MRFAVARSEGLTEEQVEQIADGYESSDLSERDKAVLAMTDAIIGDPRSLGDAAKTRLREQLTDAEIVEVAPRCGAVHGPEQGVDNARP